MKIFGKSLSEYARFVKAFLAIILVVGVLRLALSMAGVPNANVSGLSMSVAVLAGALYCAVRMPKTGFGSYRHLLPLMVLLSGVANGFTAVGILLAIATGQDNVFTAPEYSGGGDGKTWFHVGAHLVLGLTLFPLILWGVGSLAMFVTKKLAARGGTAAAKA
ncbi:MAG: hypothetical protein ACRD1Z_17535 [Vicinamibacteria bacterium]